MWLIANPFEAELKEGVEYELNDGKIVTFRKISGESNGHDWITRDLGGQWYFTKEGKAHGNLDLSKTILKHVVGIKKG